MEKYLGQLYEMKIFQNIITFLFINEEVFYEEMTAECIFWNVSFIIDNFIIHWFARTNAAILVSIVAKRGG